MTGEPSAEIHTQHAAVWAPMPAPSKELDNKELLVRESLFTLVKHAVKCFPGADHVGNMLVI